MWEGRGRKLVPGKSRKENIFVNGIADELIMTTLPKCVHRIEKNANVNRDIENVGIANRMFLSLCN